VKALPEPVRLGVLALRQALLAKHVPGDSYLAEALWELAHARPGSAFELGESLVDAARWVEREVECVLPRSTEPAAVVGFDVPAAEDNGGDGTGGNPDGD